MLPLLDDERLSGPHVARISARPTRYAYGLREGDRESFRALVELQCQVWGGAACAVLPLDEGGFARSLYARRLPGSQIDSIHGLGGLGMNFSQKIDPSVELPFRFFQLAIGLLQYGKPDHLAPLEICELDRSDPWSDIYLACLGSLPLEIDSRLIRAGNWLPDLKFGDFLKIQRKSCKGSLEDLLARTWPREPVVTPRQLSMVHLAYGGTASPSIRSNTPVLPDADFPRFDAGPNVVVVCSPGSTDDLALLWNLRAAHGDHYALPIGLPRDILSKTALTQISSHLGLARHGFASHSVYVTSSSLSVDELRDRAGVDGREVSFCSVDDMLTLGFVGGWARDEVLIWSQGKARYQLLDWGSHREVLEERNLARSTRFHFDLTVEDSRLPSAEDFRTRPINGEFYGGAHTTWAEIRSADKVAAVQWPSRLLMARSLASIRGSELRESAPGVAARILVEKLGGLDQMYMLRHAPLLNLLESMATRQGFSWYKSRLRKNNMEADPVEAVGGSVDEMPEKSFHDFKKALRNSTPATKYWLAWAERASLLVKGFPLQCSTCGAKQWIPVNSFSPPIICRGCVKVMEYPFGDRASIDFQYRISEQTRRVYESDAMGHLLAASFFDALIGGRGGDLIGLHPGMSVYAEDDSELGEADVLLLTGRGDFIPVEVKRTRASLLDGELVKLGALASQLHSPWSAIAVCQYATSAGEDFGSLETRNPDGTHQRMALSYDQLLDGRLVWTINDDPFAVRVLTTEQIDEREGQFVKGLTQRESSPSEDWFTDSMIRRAKSQKKS